jgi:hypothetical protein
MYSQSGSSIVSVEIYSTEGDGDFRLLPTTIILAQNDNPAVIDMQATAQDADGDVTPAIDFSVSIGQTVSTGDAVDEIYSISDNTEALIDDFDLNGLGAGDTLDFEGSVSVASDSSAISASGTSGTSIDGHNISDGIATFFDDTDQVLINSASRIESAIDYLSSTDLGNAGVSVAFKATIDGVTSTYVYNQNDDDTGSFSLVKLDNVDAGGIDTTSGANGGTDDYIHID